MNERLARAERSAQAQTLPRASRSPSSWRLAWRRFRRHKLALIGGTVILLLLLSAILAPWLTPHEFSGYNLSTVFKAPMTQVPSANPTLDCLRPAVLFWECGLYPLGTDDLGRDILTRVLHGGRVSLLVGFIAALATTLLGSLLGAMAAYHGGRLDALISRFIDIMLSIPTFPLLLILTGLLAAKDSPLASVLDQILGPNKSIFIIIVVIVSLSWMATARLVRGEILSLREREFTEAARAVGASHTRIIVHHLLPNAMAVIIVQATLMVGEAILIESGLSYLGLGIQPPAVSWGNMLSRAQDFFIYPNGFYSALFPGLFIFLTVLCFNFVGDGLRDALDPRSRR
jgi:peptide/nickel transport system permease protein